MHIIDWIFLAVPLLLIMCLGIYTQRYMKSVAGFMSGGRLAGRYLLAVAGGEMQAGAVVFVAAFEVIANAGFTHFIMVGVFKCSGIDHCRDYRICGLPVPGDACDEVGLVL